MQKTRHKPDKYQEQAPLKWFLGKPQKLGIKEQNHHILSDVGGGRKYLYEGGGGGQQGSLVVRKRGGEARKL